MNSYVSEGRPPRGALSVATGGLRELGEPAGEVQLYPEGIPPENGHQSAAAQPSTDE